MKSFFSVDGWFYKAMTKITQLFCLNVLWFVGCLPIITIGASTVAAISVCMKIAQNEEGYLFRGYKKAFCENFVPATILWGMIAGIGYLFYINWQVMHLKGNPLYYQIIFWAAAVLVLQYFVYAFPLTARYENTIRQTLKNSLFFSIRFLVRTVIMLAQCALVVVFSIFTQKMYIIGILFGPALIIYIVAAKSLATFSVYEKINAEHTAAEEQKMAETKQE